MKKIFVRYKVRPDKAAENESLVRDVYKQLQERQLAGFHYATFKLADGVSFVHIAFADTDEADAAFNSLPAFKEFQANIKDRCEEPPAAGLITVVGSHDFRLPSP